jgi:flagellar hook-associated protein 1 FlgK
MSGLFGVLRVGGNALGVNQRDLATTSQNIANAQTPGFSRQQVVRKSLDGGGTGVGAGVGIDVIERLRDRFIEQAYLNGREGSAYAESRAAWLGQIESPFNESEVGGVGEAVGELFNSMRGLATTPRDAGARARVRNAAMQLSRAFERASSTLGRVASDIDGAIGDALGEANQLAARLASLNAAVVRAEGASGAPANDLRDQRDEVARKLIEQVGGQVLEGPSGLTVLVAGRSLVEGERAGSFELQNAAAGARVMVRDPSGVAMDATAAMTRGRVGASLEVRDRVLVDLRARLDGLAYEIANRVNEVHRAGFGLDGVGGRDLFAPPAQIQDAAAKLDLSAAVRASPDAIAASLDAASPSDNRNALALAAIGDEGRAALGGQRAQAFWSATAGQAGRALADARGLEQAELARATQAEGLRAQVSGVTTDEEMVKVLELQASFQAVAKVIAAADQMLDSLLKI